MLKLLKLPIEKISDKTIRDFKERLITIKEILGYKPSLNEISKAFKEVLKLDITDGDLNEWERKELEKQLINIEVLNGYMTIGGEMDLQLYALEKLKGAS